MEIGKVELEMVETENGEKDRGRGRERPLIEHLLGTRHCDSCFTYTLTSSSLMRSSLAPFCK